MYTFDLIEMKNFCSRRHKEDQWKATGYEKIFVVHISDKRVIFRIKKLLQSN